MRKIREILRLRNSLGRAHREIAEACGLSPSTVGDCLCRFRVSGLPWPLPENMGDAELERKLYQIEPNSSKNRPLPEWEVIQREMRRKNVTLSLLWQEYKTSNPDGFEYSWFCGAYGAWLGRRDLVMRQEHKLGEKCFVDYAGDTIPVIDPETGEVRDAQIFLGILGGSKYTYAEASWSQDLPSWIAAHVRMLEFFQGCPEVLIPDNLKSGVTKPDYYEPDLNPTYQEMAEHYNIAVIPARVRKPRDKALVENAVLIVGRWILAALRNRRFFCLASLNEAIGELLEGLNNRPFQKLPGCRRQIFEDEEKATLRPLPPERYSFGQWKKARVHLDYHIEVEGNYYSVPYRFAREQVEVRMTGTTIEIFHLRNRIASHARSYRRGVTTTIKEHMPSHHRNKAEWTPERIVSWAAALGPSVQAMVNGIMDSRAHPEQGFRACFGLLGLAKRYEAERLEKACCRAVRVGAFSYKSVKSILENGLDKGERGEGIPSQRTAGCHENVRGARYYEERTNDNDESTDSGKAVRTPPEGNGIGIPGTYEQGELFGAFLRGEVRDDCGPSMGPAPGAPTSAAAEECPPETECMRGRY